MDWPTILASESKIGPIIRVDEYARRFGLTRRAVNASLRRHASRGLVERVASNTYVNLLARDFTPRDLLSLLRPDSYVSLDSALAEFGVTTQVPNVLTCVSPLQARDIKSKSVKITFRTLKQDLFWGFTKEKTRYGVYNLAEPEKALLDWIYFLSLDGYPIDLDELLIDRLDRVRLLAYSKKFTKPVRTQILTLLAETPQIQPAV